MRKFLSAAMVAATLSLGTTSGGLVSSTVASAGSPVQDAAYAVTMERVGGSLHSYYKKKYPAPTLNWNADGCSIPPKLSSHPVLTLRKSQFKQSCNRHDFGYRNHGKSGISRSTVDSVFRSNMKRQCNTIYGPGFKRTACKLDADLFYAAVRAKGGSYW